MDDSDELLRQCQLGDASALSALVRRYQEPVFRLAWRMVGNPALAEDATAEVMVKLWSKAGQWQGRAGAGTWIYRMAYRTILDVQRGQQRWWRRSSKPGPIRLHDPASNPVDNAIEKDIERERSQRIQEALAQLTPADRALVHLYYFENKSLADLEPILNATRDTLKMRLARARQRLRKLLDNEEHG